MAAKLKTRSETREIGPLSMRGSFVPGSLDSEKRTVDVIWTTGARVLRGYFDRFYEELSLDPAHVRMDRLNAGAPLLNSHNGYDLRGVIGVVESAKLEKKRGVATVRFPRAEDDPEADAIYRKISDGIIRNISVGYQIHRMEKIEAADDKVPVYRAVDWEPHEISMVPIGADAGAGVRAATAATNPCVFVFEERIMDPDETETPETPAPGEAAVRSAPLTPAPDGQVARRERERIQGIGRVGRTLSTPADVIEQHIEAGTTLEAFRAIAIDGAAKATQIPTGQPGQRIDAGETSSEKWVRGVGDWLVQRAALTRLVTEAGEKRGETVKVDPGEFRGMSFIELARQSLERAGVRTSGWDKQRVFGEALTQRGIGLHATGDFSTALENVMNKVLLAAFGVTPDTWSRFCRTGSVSDYRAHPRYRMGTFGALGTVLEGGEYMNMALADGTKETLTALKKGAMVGISREALINDDMGIFSSIGAMVGRSAKLTIEKDVYALLALNSGDGPTMTDTIALFHTSSHGANKTTGAALSVAAIDADRVAMGSQLDPSSNEILDLRPAILLVPIGLGGEARVINDAQYDPDTANKLQRPNKVRGLFRDIIDTARLTGTRRYLFADPAIAPTIEVAFLDGRQEPYLEVKDGWRSDGVEWKVRLEYAVGAVDFRGAITNAGT